MPFVLNSTCSSPLKKNVRFFVQIDVVLIPTKQEYIDAKLAGDIWYRKDEEKVFKGEAIKEIKCFIKKQADDGNNVNIGEAKRALYQPEECLQESPARYDIESLVSPRLVRGAFVFEARRASKPIPIPNKIQTSSDSANRGQTHTL